MNKLLFCSMYVSVAEANCFGASTDHRRTLLTQGTGGFPEQENLRGVGRCQELAAHVMAAKTWAGPGAMMGGNVPQI